MEARAEAFRKGMGFVSRYKRNRRETGTRAEAARERDNRRLPTEAGVFCQLSIWSYPSRSPSRYLCVPCMQPRTKSLGLMAPLLNAPNLNPRSLASCLHVSSFWGFGMRWACAPVAAITKAAMKIDLIISSPPRWFGLALIEQLLAVRDRYHGRNELSSINCVM